MIVIKNGWPRAGYGKPSFLLSARTSPRCAPRLLGARTQCVDNFSFRIRTLRLQHVRLSADRDKQIPVARM